MSLLWITTSPKSDDKSESKKFGKMIVDRLISSESLNVTQRDVSKLPHLVDHPQKELIDEALQCDTLVISTPMWNYLFPSSLKAWIDHITVSGETFHYDADQHKVIGHCKAKKVYVVVTCGTSVAEQSDRDFITPYLRYLLSYIGMSTIQFVWINNVYDPLTNPLAIINRVFDMKDDKEVVEDVKEVAEDVKEVAEDVKEVVEDVKEVVEDVKEVAEDVKEVVEDTKEVVEDVKEVVEDVKEVAEDVKEVVEDVKEVAEDVKEVAEDVKEVVEDVKEVVEDVKEVVEDVKEVAEDVKEVAEDVKEVVEDVKEVAEDIKEVVEDVKEVDAKLVFHGGSGVDVLLSAQE